MDGEDASSAGIRPTSTSRASSSRGCRSRWQRCCFTASPCSTSRTRGRCGRCSTPVFSRPRPILRRRLFGELVLPDVDRRGPGDPRAALGVERAGRRGDDRHASQRYNVVPALLWLAWRANPPGREHVLGVLAAACAVAGIGGYCIYNYMLSGDPFTWYHSIQRWGYYPGGDPERHLHDRQGPRHQAGSEFLNNEWMAPYDTLNALSATAALAIVPLVWRRLGVPMRPSLLGLVLPLSSGQFEGLGGKHLGAVPAPDSSWLARRRHPARGADCGGGDALHPRARLVHERPSPLLKSKAEGRRQKGRRAPPSHRGHPSHLRHRSHFRICARRW